MHSKAPEGFSPRYGKRRWRFPTMLDSHRMPSEKSLRTVGRKQQNKMKNDWQRTTLWSLSLSVGKGRDFVREGALVRGWVEKNRKRGSHREGVLGQRTPTPPVGLRLSDGMWLLSYLFKK